MSHCVLDPNLEIDVEKMNKEFMERSEVRLMVDFISFYHENAVKSSIGRSSCEINCFDQIHYTSNVSLNAHA